MKYVQVPATIQVVVPSYLQKESKFLKNELTIPTLENLKTSKPISFNHLYDKVKESISKKINKEEYRSYMKSLSRVGLIYKVFTQNYTDGYALSPLGNRLLTSVAK